MTNIIDFIKKIHIHPLFWAVTALAVMTAHFFELLILFLIIFIHELGHALTAAYFSWRLKKITILPFGGVAEMDEHGNRPLKEEALVILAGPLQHVWMVAFALIGYQASLISDDFFTLFMQYNIMIFLFNLLPVWPLDGGKLVFLLLSLKKSFPQAHLYTLCVSFASVLLFVGFIFVTEPLNLNVWLIVSFLLFSLYYEWKQRRYIFFRFLLERYYGKNTSLHALVPLTVNADDRIIDILERFQRGCKHPIIIEQDGKERGTLDENELLHTYFNHKDLTAKVGDLLYYY